MGRLRFDHGFYIHRDIGGGCDGLAYAVCISFARTDGDLIFLSSDVG